MALSLAGAGGADRAVRAGAGRAAGGARPRAEGGAAVAAGAGKVERARGGRPLRRLGDERRAAHPLPPRGERAPHRRLRPGRVGTALRLPRAAARGVARRHGRGARGRTVPLLRRDERGGLGEGRPAHRVRPLHRRGLAAHLRRPPRRATRGRSGATSRSGRRARRLAELGSTARARPSRAWARSASSSTARSRASACACAACASSPRAGTLAEVVAVARAVALPRHPALPARVRLRRLHVAARRVRGAAASEDPRPRVDPRPRDGRRRAARCGR